MASRVEIVVTFLALLELIRLKQVRAIQPDEFEEIEIAPGRKLMPRVLIAGCGYVGTATADLFQSAGWEVEGWTYSARFCVTVDRQSRIPSVRSTLANRERSAGRGQRIRRDHSLR